MREKLFIFILVTVILSFAQGTMVSGDVHVPFPSDIQIVGPDPSLPDNIKGLSGWWEGKWEALGKPETMDTALIVEKITQSSAEVVYTVGEYRTTYYYQPGKWKRSEGKTKIYPGEGEETILDVYGNGAIKFYYSPKKPNVLRGIYIGQLVYGRWETTLKRKTK